jgi:hypothetical protein
VSGAFTGLRGRVGRLLVEFYPEPWRGRYRAEILALIDDDPPTPRGLGSLLVGAADAHLHPRRAGAGTVSAHDRMRLSVGATFCCWILVSLAGAGFQKETEDGVFQDAAAHHPLLGLAHGAIVAGAALGTTAIAIGGLPLLGQAARQAYDQRDRRLAALLALPPAAILSFVALTWLLIALASPVRPHPRGASALAILAPWWLGGLACAITCAAVPKLVLRRTAPSARSLRRASLAAVPLALAMAAITLALALYDLSLALLAPGLAAQSSGPLWPSTGVTLAAGAAVAAAGTSLALVSAVRGCRALAQRA